MRLMQLTPDVFAGFLSIGSVQQRALCVWILRNELGYACRATQHAAAVMFPCRGLPVLRLPRIIQMVRPTTRQDPRD